MKKLFTLFWIVVGILFLCNSSSFAQLSGTKNIPGDYATISAAVTDLNTQGVGSGGVTFNVNAGYTETTTAQILITATGTAGNPIVFQKSGAGSNPLITRTDAGTNTTSTLGGQGDAIIIIQGGDYITFDGISVTASNQGIEYGYYLRKASTTDGCKYITIKNAAITMTKGTSAYVAGIYSSNNDAASLVSSATGITVASTGGRNENVTITGNTISNVFTGILLRGYNHTTSPYDFYDQNFTIGQSGAANTIQNFAGNAASSAYGVYIIYHNNINVSYNTISNTAGGGSNFTSTGYGVFYSTATNGNGTFTNNNITLTATTGQLSGIYFGTAGTSTNVCSYNNVNLTQAGTSAVYFIYSTGAVTSTTINYNTFSSTGGLATTSTSYMIYASSTTPTVNIIGNQTSGSINKSGASGSFYCYYNLGSPTSGTETITNNTFSSITAAGTSSLYGIYSNTATGQNRVLANNTVSGFTGGSGTTYTITGLSGTTNQVYGNTIYNISGGGTIYGLYFSGTTPTAYNNTIYNISSTGASTIYGLYNAGSGTTNCYKNRIYNLSGNNASTTIYGMYISTGTANYNYNNFISDLRATAANAAIPVAGIYVSGGTSVGLYYNSIYLNATSSGTLFGVRGIYASTTPTLDMRNNLVVTTSTPNGTGLNVAYMRNSATLTTYSASSNNNDFYAGTPSASNLIYTDGTNIAQNITQYKAIMSTRDQSSFSENPPFLNISSTPYDLHISTTTPTQLESGGTVVSTPIAITDDYDGNTRNASTPDVGADEFTGQTLDLTPPTISYTPLTNTQSTSARTLTATISDASNVPQSGIGLPVLYWKINATGSYASATGTWVAGNTYSFTFGAGAVMFDSVFYYVCAQDNAAAQNTTCYPSTGASGFTPNPPAASTPPTNPSKYYIANTPLSGDYTVGATPFNKITGKNITFRKVIKKVMVEETIEEPTQPVRTNGDKIEGEQRSSSSKVSGKTRMVEVEKVEWIPMENGKEYKGDLFVKRNQNPGLNYPNGVNGVYLTITAAINDLNLRGVSGATRLLLVDASYTTGETYPLTVNVNNDTYLPTATNTVTIKPNTGITATISGVAASTQIFKILNSYVTIDGSNTIGGTTRDLTITNTSTTAPQVVVIGSTGTTPIVGSGLKNCTITNGVNTSSAVIVSDGTTPGNAGYFNNITIQNNLIQLAYMGLYCNAVQTGTNGSGSVIANNNLNSTGTNAIRYIGIYTQGAYGVNINNNTIGNFESATAEYDRAIWLATGANNINVFNNTISPLNYTGTSTYYPTAIAVTNGVTASNVNIYGNTISGMTSSGANSFTNAIYISGAESGFNIYRNNINNIKNTSTTGYNALGIYLGSSLTSNVATVYNNILYDIAGYGSSTVFSNGIGIYIVGGAGYNIYFNTVRLSTEQTSTSGIPNCVYISSSITAANAIDLRDNIFFTSQTVGAQKYAIYSASASGNTIFTDINYNDYFSAGANLCYLNGVNCANLAAWQAATGKDGSSNSVDPGFVSLTDLHPSSSLLYHTGTAIGGITTDYSGATRNNPPCIGAYEFTPGIDNPTGFSATASSASQINLLWTNNGNNDNVVLAFNTTNSFGTPDPFVPLNPGDPIPGGGTVLYFGMDGNFSHSPLTENTTYYYKVWSCDPSYMYSTGITASATTPCGNKTLPYSQGFNSTSIPACFTTQTVVGTSAIQYVASSSNPTTTPQEGSQYVFWNSFSSGWPSGNETRLVTPRITTTGTASVDVKFYWYNENNSSYNSGTYLLEGVQVQYSLDAVTWTDAGAFVPRHDGTLTAGTGQWKLKTITLPAGAGNQSTIYVGLKFHSSYGDNCSLDNLSILATPTITDVGPFAIDQSGSQYYKNGTTNIPMTGVVKNFGTTTESFVVTRTISGTGYTSTQTVTSLGAGATANVTFADFTGFTTGTTYTIKDSTYLATDAVANNDTLSKVFTPNIAKVNCVYWGDAASRDSLIACMTNAGMTSADYDILSTASYTGSLRVWSTVWVLFSSGGNWTAAQRDTMKAFLDNSTAGWKKTLVVFGNDLGYNHDRAGATYTTTADSTFYRYYLKSRYLGDSWLGITPTATGKFKGSPDYTFPAIVSDSCYDPYPDYVVPVNGGASAFIPLNRVNNTDTVNAVYYAGTTWNMFYGTNIFSGYRTKADGGKSPTSVFYVIMNWINMVGGTLPVEMTAFNSSVNKNNVTLKWTTATETNNKGFDIERKAANGNWVKAGNLQGSNTKTTPTNYTFEDKKLNAGKYNYRLKQVDVNGNYRYFNLNTVVEVGVPKSYSLSQNYPNPFNPVTKIDFELPFDSKVKMVLYDILGREVKVLVPNELKQAGFYTLEINALNLASGTYFYRMVANSQNKDFVFTKKMVVVK